MRAEALQQGLLFRAGLRGVGAGQQRQEDARRRLLVELHAGDVAHPVGEVEFLVVRVGQDVLPAVVLEIVIPVAHRPVEHEAAARIEIAEFAVVGVDGRGFAEIDLARLCGGGVQVPEQQGAELPAGGAGQPLEQRQPGVFVEYAFIAESDQTVVLGFEVPLSHVSFSPLLPRPGNALRRIYGIWPPPSQDRRRGLSDGRPGKDRTAKEPYSHALVLEDSATSAYLY
ncbi:hypothetical protein D9M71_144230 [compost metagenome]